MKIGVSFSVGKVAYAHDVRESNCPLPKNVSQQLVCENVNLVDKLNGKSIEDYTNDRMRPYIDEYNAKQRRNDRKIKGEYVDYWNNLNDKGKGQLCYEAVIQFGEHESLGKQYYESDGQERERLKDEFVSFYKSCIDEFETNYPHLEVLYATIHFDEPQGTPHMHLCYQPIGDTYKQGLSHQISIGNALTSDGIERVKSRKESLEVGGYQIAKFYKQFTEDFMKPTLEKRGYEIKELIGGRKHQDVDSFKETQELNQTFSQGIKNQQDMLNEFLSREEKEINYGDFDNVRTNDSWELGD